MRVQELYANLHVPVPRPPPDPSQFPAIRILEEAVEVIVIWSHSAKVIGPETVGFTTQTSSCIQVSPPLLVRPEEQDPRGGGGFPEMFTMSVISKSSADL